jgi:hypothetical protein
MLLDRIGQYCGVIGSSADDLVGSLRVVRIKNRLFLGNSDPEIFRRSANVTFCKTMKVVFRGAQTWQILHE